MSVQPNTSFDRLPIPAHQAVAKNATAKTKNVDTASATQTAAKPADGGKPFSFWDIVDIVNPLQHIPVVDSIYRKITGDEIGNFARVAGGALYGGIFGVVAGGINAIVATETGKDIGGNVLAKITGDDSTDVAETAPAPVAAPAPEQVASLPSAAAGHAGRGNALFDYSIPPMKHAEKTKDAEEKAAVPVIEVRPEAKSGTGTPVTSLPEAEAVAGLPDIMPGSEGPSPLKANSITADKETVMAPKNKAEIQRSMMDALLKMQELDKSDEKSEAVSADNSPSL